MDGAMSGVSSSATIGNFVDVGDPGAPIGSPAWCKASHLQLCATKRKTDQDVRHLKFHLIEFREKERWKQLTNNKHKPFRSWEDYLTYPEPAGLGISKESADAIMKAVEGKLIGEVLVGKHGGDHGNQHTGGKRQPCTTSLPKYGTREHWLARLDRDELAGLHTGVLADKVRRGELSANAAAIKAGYRKKPVKCCPKCGHEW